MRGRQVSKSRVPQRGKVAQRLSLRLLRRENSRRSGRCPSIRRKPFSSLCRLILFPNQPQPRQRPTFIRILNLLRTFRHQSRLPSGGHHFYIAAQLRLHAREHPIHHIHRAIIETRLHVRDSIRPNHFSRILNLHARQSCSSRKQRFRSNPQPRRNHSPKIFPARRNRIKRNRRPKIHNDARPPILVKSCDAIHDPVRANFHRIIYQHRHPGFYAQFHEQRLLTKINPRHFRQRPIHRRHHRTDNHAANRIAVQLRQSKQISRKHAVLIDSLLPRRRQPPIGNQLFATKNAQHGIRVSDIDRQQHLPRLRHIPGNHRHHLSVVALHLQQPFRTKPRRRPCKALCPVRHSHTFPPRIARHRFEFLRHPGRPLAQKTIVVVLEFPQQPHQQFQSRNLLTRLDPQRSRRRSQFSGKFFLIHVQPNSHDHKSHLRWLRMHLGQNPAHFLSAHKQIIRPLQVRRQSRLHFDGRARRKPRHHCQKRRLHRRKPRPQKQRHVDPRSTLGLPSPSSPSFTGR